MTLASRYPSGGAAVMPSTHQYMQVLAGRPVERTELVEVPLLEGLALRDDHVSLVVGDRTGEHVEAIELTGQHGGEGVLDQLHVFLGQVGDAGIGSSPSMKP